MRHVDAATTSPASDFRGLGSAKFPALGRQTCARGGKPCCVTSVSVFFQGKPGLDGDLILLDTTILDRASYLNYFEPSEVAQGGACLVDCSADRLRDAVIGGADDFHDIV